MAATSLNFSHLLSWTVFLKRLIQSHWDGLKAPYKYFFVVTKKCGSKCMYCKIWKEIPQDELKLEEYLQIARGIGSKMSWLNITGGEPTDRSDLVEVIRIFKQECPRLLFVNFTSNGLQPDRLKAMAEKIVALNFGKVVINISLDGPPEVNDRIRGVQGSFEKAMESFLLLKKIKGLKTKLGLTLYSQNVGLIEETYLSAKRLYPALRKSDLHLNVPHQSEHYYGNSQVKISTDDYRDQIVGAIEKFRKTTGLLSYISGTNFVEYLYQKRIPEYLNRKKSPLDCKALQSSVYISEKGVVFPCTIWNKPLGSLVDSNYDLSKVAQTDAYKKARLEVREKACPNCWTPCEAFTSILGSIPTAIS